MTYALGIALRAENVQFIVAVNGDETEMAVDVPAELYVDGTAVAVGDAARSFGSEQPAGMVRDIIDHFDTDRLWFAGGRMFTPDEALYELLAAIVEMVSKDRSEAPLATTLVPLTGWNDEVRERLTIVVDRLQLHAAETMDNGTASEAALDAVTRLPATRVAIDNSTLPDLTSGFGADTPVARIESDDQPLRQDERSPVLGLIAFVFVSVALVGTVAVVLNQRGDNAESSDTSLATTSSPPPPTLSVTTAPARSLVVGVIGGDDLARGLRRHAEFINETAPVFGRDTFIVSYSATNLLDEVEQLRGQGATGVVTDLTGSPLVTLLDASAPYAVCLTGERNSVQDASVVEQLDSTRVVLSAEAAACASFLALSAIQANSLDPARVAASIRDLLGERGIECETFAQCSVYVSAEQPISFAIDGQSVEVLETKGTS